MSFRLRATSTVPHHPEPELSFYTLPDYPKEKPTSQPLAPPKQRVFAKIKNINTDFKHKPKAIDKYIPQEEVDKVAPTPFKSTYEELELDPVTGKWVLTVKCK